MCDPWFSPWLQNSQITATIIGCDFLNFNFCLSDPDGVEDFNAGEVDLVRFINGGPANYDALNL